MNSPEADAIGYAIAARVGARAHERIGISDQDADALARRLAQHIAGMSAADAIGEALAVGVVAGRRLGQLPGVHVRSTS